MNNLFCKEHEMNNATMNCTMQRFALPVMAGLAMLAASSCSALAGDCEPHWDGAIGQPGMNWVVNALTVFDDGSGSGPALYAGGGFTTAGGVSANRIARWDGESWSALGSGMGCCYVYALTAFDDGSGSGPALYAGGIFTTAGGVTVNRIAKWDGESWSALGSGMNGYVYALTVFDDGSGSGPALYAGGTFTTAGGVSASRVARWDGESWSALGSGTGGAPNTVIALTVFDDGSGAGPALYAGGRFTTAGGVSANYIARWDGESWSALGSGMGGVDSPSVTALTVFDDGSGPALYAGGWFSVAGRVEANNIARWDGESWAALGSGISCCYVYALTEFDDGSGVGPALYAGGDFITAGGVAVYRIARWDGESWSPLGIGMEHQVHDLTVFDDGSGSGPALYAGGWFWEAGEASANYIAKWQGCPTDPECASADLNCDGVVDVLDLLALLDAWGACKDCGECPADLNDDCSVDVLDLLMLLDDWG
jgi:trimeric autotransporter adhesin